MRSWSCLALALVLAACGDDVATGPDADLAPDGTTIALLDFGLTKELPPGFGDGVAAMIVKGMGGDLDGAVAAARSIGFELAGDPAAFHDLIRAFMGDNDRAKNALDALRASSLKGIPSDFTIIGRAFILLNGLSHRLAPGERLIAMAVARRLAGVGIGQNRRRSGSATS